MHSAAGWRTYDPPPPQISKYRVIDKDGKTIWSGGCSNCARMIASGNLEWRISKP